MKLTRRQLLGSGVAGASLVLGACGQSSSAPSTTSTTAVKRKGILEPGSLPYPGRAVGTDQVPEIEHFVVVMMENHSFDNILGLIGRGDGFTLGADGQPTAKNPDGQGNYIHAFHMPTECQTNGVGNDWKVTHEAYDGGTCQGFVTSTSAEAMGYFTKDDLPFTLWHGQHVSHRRPVLLLGHGPDRPESPLPHRRHLARPHRRHIPAGPPAQRRDLRAVQQARDHLEGLLLDATDPRGVPAALGDNALSKGLAKIDQFYVDAAAGNLPSFSLVEPNYDDQSEENPQDIQFGDQFVGKVVNAVMSSPNWPKTMLIWTYDEHGGYYDHVPPPAAIPPDDVPPALVAGRSPGGFDRYGFRVPSGVVSPYAKENYVSHTRLRPHLDSQDRRGEVEPARADPARRQRQQPVRYVGPRHQAGIPEAAQAPRCRRSDGEGRVPDHRCRHHSSSVGRHQGLIEGHRRGRGQPRICLIESGRTVRFTWRANRSRGMAGRDRGRARRRAGRSAVGAVVSPPVLRSWPSPWPWSRRARPNRPPPRRSR